MFIDLDVAKADATVKSDLHKILDDIQRDIGLSEMNEALKVRSLQPVSSSILLSHCCVDILGWRRQDALIGSQLEIVPPEALGWDEDAALEVNKAARLCQIYGRLDQAEPLYRRALENRERTLGPEHPSTLASLKNLSQLYHSMGKFQQAEPLMRRDLRAKESSLGPDHPSTLAVVQSLATLELDQGRLKEAEALYRRLLEGQTKAVGAESPEALITVTSLAAIAHNDGRLKEAEALHRRAWEGRRSALGIDHPDTQDSFAALQYVMEAQRFPRPQF